MPMFITAKSTEEWTEEERKISLDYDKKCRELEEEREKYRKVRQ